MPVPFAVFRHYHLADIYYRRGTHLSIEGMREAVEAGARLSLAETYEMTGQNILRFNSLLTDFLRMPRQESMLPVLEEHRDDIAEVFRDVRHWMVDEIEPLLPEFEKRCGAVDGFHRLLDDARNAEGGPWSASLTRTGDDGEPVSVSLGISIDHYARKFDLDPKTMDGQGCLGVLCALRDLALHDVADALFQIERARGGFGMETKVDLDGLLNRQAAPAPRTSFSP